ncbi:ABC transporter permease [Dongia sp.]|uniref:ABC transporter permease n=1 Tax=Dongia sp. TaxID=1977262 RepID=UPI0035AF98A4
MSARPSQLPRWIEIGLLPVINVLMALVVAGLILWTIGANPFDAIAILVNGAFGSGYGWGYTLYYATSFIFTGLAVAVAFHAGLFNIGGEGQAYIGGLGAGIVALALDNYMPAPILLPLAIVAAGIFGAAWAIVPAYLQAYRGSHIVITTIMFNFLAASLMVYLLVDVFRDPGQMSTQSRTFGESAFLPEIAQVFGWVGIEIPSTPLNLSLVWALVCCVLVEIFIWRSRLGYEIRAMGLSPRAAIYAGIKPARIVLIAMAVSGGLAGFVGVNEILGVQHRMLLEFVAGAGFTGIAVALMGRNHPFGIVLASLLFGALYQGGAELAFEIPTVTREMIIAIQGLIILFSGALAYMNRPWVERLYLRFVAGWQREVSSHG